MKRRDIIFILIVIGVFGLLFYLSRTGKKPPVVKRSVPAHQPFYDDLDAKRGEWERIPLSSCGTCHWPTMPASHPAKGKSPEEEKKGLTCTQCHTHEPAVSK